MPSHLHEVLVEMFRERPTLAAELLGGPLGVTVPAFQRARLSPGELTDVLPTEYRADAVVTLTADDAPVTSVVVVLTALPPAARDYLEDLMALTKPYQYQSDFARRYVAQGKAEGEAKGEAKAVLAFLDARGIDVPDGARKRITTCTDLDQLDTWVRRAATANTISDLFGER